MKTVINTIVVVFGMIAAAIAGFWARDQIEFHKYSRTPYRPYTNYNRYQPYHYEKKYSEYENAYRNGWSAAKEDSKYNNDDSYKYAEDEENNNEEN